MVGAKDFLELLGKVPLWKRLSEVPSQVDALEKRIAALEAKPRLPMCEACGEGFAKLNRTEKPSGPFDVFEGSGMQIRVYKCDKCGFETKKSSG